MFVLKCYRKCVFTQILKWFLGGLTVFFTYFTFRYVVASEAHITFINLFPKIAKSKTFLFLSQWFQTILQVKKLWFVWFVSRLSLARMESSCWSVTLKVYMKEAGISSVNFVTRRLLKIILCSNMWGVYMRSCALFNAIFVKIPLL